MYDDLLEQLIDAALVDGVLTEKEKQILFKRAQSMGMDLDEFEMLLEARIYKMNQAKNAARETQQTSAPKSDKYGDVKRCPACGAIVKAFTTRCPECDHDFSNIASNSSIQRLFEMLNQVEMESQEDATTLLGSIGRTYGKLFAQAFGGDKDTRKRKSIIQNFPIPTTKDDILEFLSLAVPLARKPGLLNSDYMAREMYLVWRSKCEQIIMKAKFSMQDDKQTMDLIKEYAKELNIKI